MDPCVVLLSDFGDSEYAGVMRGVVLQRAPRARLVDLAHDVGPQAVREGAWLLSKTFRWFPRGSVFLCVVDPGVGTARRAVAAETASYFFVGPDNGLLWPAVREDGLKRAVELAPPAGASATFHGRDVFAPAAGLLAAGCPIASLGAPVERLVEIDVEPRGREGEIMRVDRFGNCITNLPPIPGRTSYAVACAAGAIPKTLPFYPTYQEAPGGAPFLIENAYGTLEIACRDGSAHALVGAGTGVRLRLE